MLITPPALIAKSGAYTIPRCGQRIAHRAVQELVVGRAGDHAAAEPLDRVRADAAPSAHGEKRSHAVACSPSGSAILGARGPQGVHPVGVDVGDGHFAPAASR